MCSLKIQNATTPFFNNKPQNQLRNLKTLNLYEHYNKYFPTVKFHHLKENKNNFKQKNSKKATHKLLFYTVAFPMIMLH